MVQRLLRRATHLGVGVHEGLLVAQGTLPVVGHVAPLVEGAHGGDPRRPDREVGHDGEDGECQSLEPAAACHQACDDEGRRQGSHPGDEVRAHRHHAAHRVVLLHVVHVGERRQLRGLGRLGRACCCFGGHCF